MSERDLQRFGRETAPDEPGVQRLRELLAAEQQADERTAAMLRELPSPDGYAELRVRSRVRATLHGPRRSRAPAWMAATGLAVLVVGLGLALRDDPPVQGEVAGGSTQPLPGLQLAAAGVGELGGTESEPRVEWTSGRLDVAVDPGAGLELSVVTTEATVRVVGTVFSVERNGLGTHVAVEQGRVAVDCADGGRHDLRLGQEAMCIPVTASGLLARARALQGLGDHEGAVLAARGGMAKAAAGPIAVELRLVDAQALAGAGRRDEARRATEGLLASGAAHRQADSLRLAIRLAGPDASCSSLEPRLEALTELEPTPAELGRLADCVAPRDTVRARALLLRALEGRPDPAERASLRRRLRALRR